MSFTSFYVVSSLNQNESASWSLIFIQDPTCWNSKIYFALTIYGSIKEAFRICQSDYDQVYKYVVVVTIFVVYFL